MTYVEAERIIKRGDVVSLRHALDDGLDPNLNVNGHSLLMVAAYRGDTAVGRLLIDRGAEVDARQYFYEGAVVYSPLSLAMMSGHASFVKLLLDHGTSFDCGFNGKPIDTFFDWYQNYTSGPVASIGCVGYSKLNGRSEMPNRLGTCDQSTHWKRRFCVRAPL